MTDRNIRARAARQGHTGRAGAGWGLLLVAALAALALAGCRLDGGAAADVQEGGASPTTQEQEDETGQGDPLLAFYQCLRDRGLDVADPGRGETVGLQGVDTDDPATMAVVRECAQTHLARGDGRVTVGGMGSNQADTEALIDFVDCLRGHGFDIADPAPDGRLSLPENADPHSSEFQAATRDCAEHLDGGGIRMGEPGGGEMMGRRR